MVIYKPNYVRAYTRTNQCIIYLRCIHFPNASWPTEELSPALGQPCGKIESSEISPSCCYRLPTVLSYLCTSDRLASALNLCQHPSPQLYFTSVSSVSILALLIYISLSFLLELLSVPMFPPQHLVCSFPLQTKRFLWLHCSHCSFFASLSPQVPILFA